MIVMTAAATTAFADDNGLLPVPEIAGGQLKIRGFAQMFATDVGNAQANVDFSVFRVKGIYERGWLKIGSEINFAEFDEESSNWLRELWVGAKLTDKLEVRTGRLFLASGYATPPMFVLETVQYPEAAFFSCYGWGVQFNYLGKRWEARLDITDGSDSSFPDGESGRTLICSGRAQRKFDAGSLGSTFQWSEDLWRLGLDAEVLPVKSLTLRGLVCYELVADEKTSDRIGIYLLAAYRPAKARWFELHAQADYVGRLAKEWVEYQRIKADDGTVSVKRVEMESDGTSDTVLTFGTRFFYGKDDCLSLTVDCQIPLAEEAANMDPTILGRLQFRF